MERHDELVLADDGVRLFVEVIGSGTGGVIVPNRIYLLDPFERLAAGRRLIFCDPRNRGRSDEVTDRSKLERGIEHDVEDFDAIRRHFGLERVDLIGHSYMGTAVVLYAMRYPTHVGRVVQLGAMAPDPSREYPAHLTNLDATRADVLARLGALQQERSSYQPEEFCTKFWKILRALYVADPSDADTLGWEPCDLPNERGFAKQLVEHVLPSLQRLALTDADFARAAAPVLAIHGRKDRSSPYGGGREWVSRLPNARLLTIDNGAHVPWIEEPAIVIGALDTFLTGEWPKMAERISPTEPHTL
jgi:pimeloyl-ACP methyl ester carboxylesterase